MLAGSKLRAIWLPMGLLLACGGMALVESEALSEPAGRKPSVTSMPSPGQATPLASAVVVKPSPESLSQTDPRGEDPTEAVFSFLEPRHFKAVEVTATGYYAGRESTGKSPGHPEYGITYSGVRVRKALFSTVAADPKVFPLGTILYIPGYGYGVVADTGSAIKGKKLDLYFETKKQVYDRWGKKKVQVSILRWGEGRVTEAMLDRLNGIAEVTAPETP